MKICKKIAILVIIFVLSTTLNVFADNETTINAEVKFTATTQKLKVGETVEITLMAKCETGISGLDSILSWDKTKLELTNQSQLESSTMSGVDESTGKFRLSVLTSTETADEVELVKINFKVLETVTPGEELSIILSNIELYDDNVDTVSIEEKTVTLTVADNETPKGDEEEKPKEDEENPPKDDEENPPKDDKEQKPKDDDKKKEDVTVADKEINHAGIEKVIPTAVLVIAIFGVILYGKYKKYNGIK